ncbi:MAG: gamma-glutamylcyclotransferase [Alphaproteobacteria bacterium]|nr:gamma-glutamylcyclotransferase [Alphaproteobacteria bacterium]
MTRKPKKSPARRGGNSRGTKDIWVFGYGSLMWDPDFPHAEIRAARLRGYHRALCILSTRYRGTHEKPGLVLGLDRGGVCVGRAFRVRGKDAKRVLAHLHEREMFHNVYDPRWLKAETPKGPVSAYAFVVRRDHPRYVGKLPRARAVELILQGRGQRGRSLDYLRETVRHMDELGVADTALHRLLEAAERAETRRKKSRKRT